MYCAQNKFIAFIQKVFNIQAASRVILQLLLLTSFNSFFNNAVGLCAFRDYWVWRHLFNLKRIFVLGI